LLVVGCRLWVVGGWLVGWWLVVVASTCCLILFFILGWFGSTQSINGFFSSNNQIQDENGTKSNKHNELLSNLTELFGLH